MKLFDIFKKKKKMTIKELYAPVLDEMWVCTFNFCPWDEKDNNVVIKKVKIVSARADEKGIFVESSSPYPFEASSIGNTMCGYIDRISSGWHWTGFFETEEEAKLAYNNLMLKWCEVIKSKIKKVQETHADPDAV